MTKPALEFSRPVLVNKLSEAGLEFTLEANAEEREALAARLGLVSLEALGADVTVTRWRKGGAHLIAHLHGKMIRRCDVSLEDFEVPIDEVADVRYVAPKDQIGGTFIDGELILDPESEDIPEVLEDERFDAGETIVQQLVLSLDPYPRKPGVEFEEIQESQEKTSPFAVLSNLKGAKEDPPD